MPGCARIYLAGQKNGVYNSSGQCTLLYDQSGNGRHASAVAPATYTNANVNKQDGLLFDSSYYDIGDALSNLSHYTVMVVHNAQAHSTETRALIGNSSCDMGFYNSATAGQSMNHYISINSGGASYNDTVFGGIGFPSVSTFIYNKSNIKILINDRSEIINSSYSQGITPSSTSYLGTINNGGSPSSSYYKGQIYAVIIFKTALTDHQARIVVKNCLPHLIHPIHRKFMELGQSSSLHLLYLPDESNSYQLTQSVTQSDGELGYLSSLGYSDMPAIQSTAASMPELSETKLNGYDVIDSIDDNRYMDIDNLSLDTDFNLFMVFQDYPQSNDTSSRYRPLITPQENNFITQRAGWSIGLQRSGDKSIFLLPPRESGGSTELTSTTQNGDYRYRLLRVDCDGTDYGDCVVYLDGTEIGATHANRTSGLATGYRILGDTNQSDQYAITRLGPILIAKASINSSLSTWISNWITDRYLAKEINAVPNTILWISSARNEYDSLGTGTVDGIDDRSISNKKDLSSFGNSMSQFTSSKQPGLFPYTKNGLSVINFDGTDDVLTTETVNLFNNVSAGTTWMWILKIESDSSAFDIFYSSENPNNSVGRVSYSASADMIEFKHGDLSTTKTHTLGFNPTLDVYYIYELVRDETNKTVSLYVNGSLIETESFTHTTAVPSVAYTYKISGTGTSRPLNGVLTEALVIDSLTTESDRQKVRDNWNRIYRIY